MYIYIYIHMCIYVCLYIYIYMCVCVFTITSLRKGICKYMDIDGYVYDVWIWK